MYCDHAGEKMSEWLDGRLDEAGHAELGVHLQECRGCAGELQALQALDRLLAVAPLVDAPASLRPRIMARLGHRHEARRLAIGGLALGLSALALLLLGLGPACLALLRAGRILPVLLASGPQALAQLVSLLETAGRVVCMLLRGVAEPVAVAATLALALLVLLDGFWLGLLRRLGVLR